VSSRVRLELLQRYGLLAAPLAWAGQLVSGYYFAQAHCAPIRWTVGWVPSEIGITLAAAIVAVLAEASAIRVFVDLRRVSPDAAGPDGRRRFFAVAGMVGNVLFLVAILLSGIAVAATHACRQS
jgi:hypothetical protein